MFKRKPLAVVTMAVALGATLAPISVMADDHSTVLKIEQSAQALDQAVTNLAAQAGVSIGGDANLLRGKQAPSLNGSYTVEEAFERLLESSGIKPVFVDGKTVRLERAEVSSKKANLETVTVYGELSEDSLAETSSSVSVFTGEKIDSLFGKDNVNHLLEYTPNISVFGGNNGPTVRGQDSNGPSGGSSALISGGLPRMTIQIDGRPISYNEFIYGESGIWDVDQVEIYTGPQTTTQGANAIAGSVFIKTNDPTEEFESKSRIIVGSDNKQQRSTMISGPVAGDQLMGRLSVDYKTEDTWRSTATTRGSGNPLTDLAYTDGETNPKKPDTERLRNIRAKLLYRPDGFQDFEALLTITDNDSWGPQTTIIERNEATGIKFEDRKNTASQAHWTTDANAQIMELRYRINDSVSIKNTTVFGESEIFRHSVAGFGGNLGQDGDELVNEMLLTFEPSASDFSGSLGLYYRDIEEDATVYDLFPGKLSDEKTSKSIFGELTYAVTDKLDVTVGGRSMDYSQTRTGSAGGGFITLDYDEDESIFLPRAEMNYWLSDETNVGVSVSKGYNPGALGFSFVTFQQYEYDKETVWNYEIFARGASDDQTLRWQTNVFYMDFDDQQRTATVPAPGNQVDSITENAEEAVSYGLEASLQWQLRDDLYATAGLGLLKTELKEFSSDSSEESLEGNEFAKAPSITANLGFVYELNDQATIDVSARYNDGYYTDDENSDSTKIPSYTVVDARANYQFDSNFSGFAYASNIFDKFYLTEDFSDPTTANDLAYAGDPREVGIGIQVEFD